MSSTRLLVLGVVRTFQPVHGYDVRRELLSWRANEWANVAPGSIYNALKSLARDGLVEVVGTDQVGNRPERTTYQLTGDGEKEFQSLLRATWWEVRQPLDALMPGLCFMHGLERKELLAALKHRAAHIAGVLEHIDFVAAGLPNATTPAHVKELLHLSAARVAAEIAWAKAFTVHLQRGDYDDPGPSGIPRKKGRRKKPA